MTTEQQRPTLPDTKIFHNKDNDLRLRQQSNRDDRHRARTLPPLSEGTPVFTPDRQESGHIVSQLACHSYVVSTPSREFCINRRHINTLPLTDIEDETESSETQQASRDKENDGAPGTPLHTTPQEQTVSPPVTITRSGRAVRPPFKLDW